MKDTPDDREIFYKTKFQKYYLDYFLKYKNEINEMIELKELSCIEINDLIKKEVLNDLLANANDSEKEIYLKINEYIDETLRPSLEKLAKKSESKELVCKSSLDYTAKMSNIIEEISNLILSEYIGSEKKLDSKNSILTEDEYFMLICKNEVLKDLIIKFDEMFRKYKIPPHDK